MNQPFYKANRSRFSIRMSGEREMENSERFQSLLRIEQKLLTDTVI